MTTITKYVVVLIICLFVSNSGAQENRVKKKTDSIAKREDAIKKARIRDLESKKTDIEIEEKKLLKQEIESINARLDSKKITAAEAEDLKKLAAKERASMIKYRQDLVDARINLINNASYNQNFLYGNIDKENYKISIGTDGFNININKNDKKAVKYDIKTKDRVVFAIGFNNAIGDGQSLDDSPYKLGGSGFVELGWNWQTRIFKESNFARVNYGFSFQWNKLDIKNNKLFVQDGNQTTLENFPFNAKKVKFRNTNLVFPVHLEFGPSIKKEYDNRIRYSTYNKFKIGIGGYGGVRLGSLQKIVYEDADGNRVKSKERRNFNASNFVYGLSAYVGWSDISLYAKYDLNPLFKDQAFDQNNISLGLRWDLH